jgi:hypothetical protein
MCSAWPQFEQTWIAMFSTIPRIGIPTFSNILRPLRASMRAMSWGVVTMTAPVTGTFCASVSWMSPVPGGQVDHEVIELAPLGSVRSCSSAWVTIGPRQTIGRIGLDEEADAHRLDAVPSMGSIVFPSREVGRPVMPSMSGCDGP